MFIYSILFSEIAIGAIYSAIYDTLMQGREHKSNYIHLEILYYTGRCSHSS